MEKTSAIKIEINRFDEKDNFFLWQAMIKDVLIQYGLIDVLLYDEISVSMELKDWKRIHIQMVRMIHLYLADDVVIHILGKTFSIALWLKLEKFYMMKLLTNMLFLWRQFYQLQMDEG